MVDELKIEFDEGDLADVEKRISSKVAKVNPGSAGMSKYWKFDWDYYAYVLFMSKNL